jgi:hypothetical protein
MLAIPTTEPPLAAAVVLPRRVALPRLAASVRQRKLRSAPPILAPAAGPLREAVRRRAEVQAGGAAAVVRYRAAVAPLAAAGVGASAVALAGTAPVRQREFGTATPVSTHLSHIQLHLLRCSTSEKRYTNVFIFHD